MANHLQEKHARAALILGVIEAVLGVIIIIISIVLTTKGIISVKATPYWAGIFFLVSGILGIISGIKKHHPTMIGFMVLNIISCVSAGIAAILVGIVVAAWPNVSSCAWNPNSQTCNCIVNGNVVSYSDDCTILSMISNVLIAILVFDIFATIITLSSSILGCAAVCCTRPTENTNAPNEKSNLVNTPQYR